MRHLPIPSDEYGTAFEAGAVFERCVSMVKNHVLKALLRAVRTDVETAAGEYDIKAAREQLYRERPHDRVGVVSGDKMVKVYTLRMVPKTSTGRPTYDRIMLAPVNGRCPLCGIGTVNTLDHYLPKKYFPIFSVAPNNLVPACQWCQKEKSDYYPTTRGEQLLHPYFDDLDADVWLIAEIIVGSPAGFRYFASPPDHWPSSAKARVAAHLKTLNLPLLYSSNAGSRLAEIRGRLAILHKKQGGLGAVRAHLQEEIASVAADHQNSWVAAMYRAAVASDWFCDGGFSGT